jgi:hypothetical protein
MNVYRLEGSLGRNKGCFGTDIRAETKQSAIDKFKKFFMQCEGKEPKKITVKEI